MNDEEIQQYVSDYTTEMLLRNAEDHLLELMKNRALSGKIEQHDNEWEKLSFFFIKRRAKEQLRMPKYEGK